MRLQRAVYRTMKYSSKPLVGDNNADLYILCNEMTLEQLGLQEIIYIMSKVDPTLLILSFPCEVEI